MDLTRAISTACSIGSCSGSLSVKVVVVLITRPVSQEGYYFGNLRLFSLATMESQVIFIFTLLQYNDLSLKRVSYRALTISHYTVI